MRAIFGATAARTVSSVRWQFSGGYSAIHGVVLGVGKICRHGAELMPGIAVKDAASGQRVRGGCGEANFPYDFGKILGCGRGLQRISKGMLPNENLTAKISQCELVLRSN